jgi:lysophospholipase L1-like esterase
MYQLKKTHGFVALAASTLVFSCANAQTPLQAPAQSSDSWKFDLGSGPVAAGYLAVTPETRYNSERGFGFEGDAQLTPFNGDGPDALKRDGVSSKSPFLFSAAVPEGFYDVTITLGNPTQAAATTVKAEARRLMLQNVQTAPGQLETRTFTVAVKRSALKAGRGMGLKPSQSASNWDDKLTLEFNGTNPSVRAVEIAPAKAPLGVFIAGDSTVTDQGGEPWAGWGQMLPRFFKPGVVVWNEAQSGETLTTFERSRLLQKIWETARPSDYLLIQFGHNDQKDKFEGAGPFTSYKANLKRYIAEARNRQLIPILVTPMERRRFTEAVPTATLADFAAAVRQTGQEENVPVLDLNAASLKLYAALGPEGTKKAFVFYAANSFPNQPTAWADNTHFNTYGAFELARIVASLMREAKLDLAKSLNDDYTTFDPSKPDDTNALALPVSPAQAASKPEGS